MKRIVIIGPANPYRGGIAAFNERLAKQFMTEGNEVTVYTFTLQYPSFLFPGKTQYTSDPCPEGLRVRRRINSVNPFNWISVGDEIREMNADLVIFVCGTNKSIESEGSDRQSILLPAGQDEVAAALAEANPNLVSVIISGGPCDLQKLAEVSPAIVQGWWNGLEGGRALADVLFGDIAPSGKLPFTFPVKLEDSPAYAMGNFPNKAKVQSDLFTDQYRADLGGQAWRRQMLAPDSEYTEGQLVGYRWYDTKGVTPLFAFGYGLSYVSFKYSSLATNKSSYKAKDVIKVSFELTNEGEMAADEVAQLYVRRIDSAVEWPLKELKAFSRVTLNGGETKKVTLEIPVSELRYWDVESNGWQLESGDIELLLGSASDDIRLRKQITIK